MPKNEMESLVHRTPTVGGIIKKVLAINPDLNTIELIEMVRQSVQTRGGNDHEFATAEMIDEERVLNLARASCGQNKGYSYE